jgi:hypothetical protein
VFILSDTLSIIAVDSLKTSDTLSGENYLKDAGKGFLELFSGKTPSRYTGISIDHWDNIWQFCFLLGMVVLLAILKASYRNRMSQFIDAVLVPRHLRQLMREEGFLYHPFSLLLLFNSAVVYSLLAFKTVEYFEWVKPENGFLFFLLILGCILGLLLLKILTLRLLEFLTDTDLGQRENRYSWLFFHQFSGLLLLPFLGIVLFGKSFLIVPGLISAFAIIIIFLILRLGKGVLLAIGNKVYFLHLFAYLCALEIIPLIVLIKVLMSQMNWFNELN